jgi:hypothetical protein
MPLRGPPSKNFLLGLAAYIAQFPVKSALYEQWAREYGSVYRVPYASGSSRVILVDPKAFAAFLLKKPVSMSAVRYLSVARNA